MFTLSLPVDSPRVINTEDHRQHVVRLRFLTLSEADKSEPRPLSNENVYEPSGSVSNLTDYRSHTADG